MRDDGISREAGRSNREILVAKAQGIDTNEIAAQYDLTPTRVRQILAAGTVVLADGDLDPVQVSMERRAQFEGLYEKAMALFERIPDTNPSPKVGALRLSLVALDRLATWDQVIGVIPVDHSWVYQALDARNFADKVSRWLEAAAIPNEVIDTLIEHLESDDETLSSELPAPTQ